MVYDLPLRSDCTSTAFCISGGLKIQVQKLFIQNRCGWTFNFKKNHVSISCENELVNFISNRKHVDQVARQHLQIFLRTYDKC